MAKIKVKAVKAEKVKAATRTMRLDAYSIIQRAVGEGACVGWRRAFKHTDKPNEDVAMETIADAVMNAVCEVVKFDDVEE